MKKMFLLIMLSSFTLVGCLKTRSEIYDQDEQKAVQGQVSEIRQAKMDQEIKTQSYETELRNMLGRLEILERQQNQKQLADSARELEDAKNTKVLLEQMKVFDEQLISLTQRLDKLEKEPKAEASSENKAPSAPVTGKVKSYWDKAEDMFVKKDWKNAALAYDEYTKQYPKGANVSMAYYKMGVCFQELKMSDQAKSFFEEVVNKFPNSGAARKAKYRLNQIK